MENKYIPIKADGGKTEGIQSTTDYKIFKGVIGNREIHQPHLTKLIKSISGKNMLIANPIIVNEEMRVIDGQHRLMAAQELGVPIYYTVIADADLPEVITLNANNRAWTTMDYLESFCVLGKKEYLRLRDFADEYRISVPIAIQLLSNETGGMGIKKIRDEFRAGRFTINDYVKAKNMASLLVELRKRCLDGSWAARYLLSVVKKIIEITDPKVLLEKMDRYSLVLTRRPSAKEYLLELEAFFNYGEKNKVVELV